MKKFIFVLISALFLMGATACNNDISPQEPTPQPQDEEVEVTLYYANNDYIKTGDEKYERLIPIKRTYTKDDSNFYLFILNELKKPSMENDAATELYSDLSLIDVKVDSRIAYVDISRENLSGGSLQEGFIIEQIVYTLTEFDGIDKVQFLVDGQVVESLMGHYSADQPIGRE